MAHAVPRSWPETTYFSPDAVKPKLNADCMQSAGSKVASVQKRKHTTSVGTMLGNQLWHDTTPLSTASIRNKQT
uniref:Uncharacterized protein n=1 Tax=Anguilla anguilla TaxID=7936 RepID=A0A0E9TXJ5_ANGAN